MADDEFAAKVDAGFGRLTPEDLSTLQQQLAAADDAARPSLERLTESIQAAMDRRMVAATKDVSELLMSSGDIEAEIVECLKRQDSPLPILTVLQMNMGKAQQDGKQQQEQALTFVFNRMNELLEAKLPPANRLLTRVLGMEDVAGRRQLLREHLAQKPGGALQPEDLSAAIVQLVKDAESKLGGAPGTGGTALQDTLGLIRRTAVDAGVVVREFHGTGGQQRFMEELQPLFQALSRV